LSKVGSRKTEVGVALSVVEVKKVTSSQIMYLTGYRLIVMPFKAWVKLA